MIRYDWLGYEIEYKDDGYRCHSVCKQRIEEVLLFKKNTKILKFEKVKENENRYK